MTIAKSSDPLEVLNYIASGWTVKSSTGIWGVVVLEAPVGGTEDGMTELQFDLNDMRRWKERHLGFE